jgi:hypothetical protein
MVISAPSARARGNSLTYLRSGEPLPVLQDARLDVFTNQPFTGIELAVFLDAAGMLHPSALCRKCRSTASSLIRCSGLFCGLVQAATRLGVTSLFTRFL